MKPSVKAAAKCVNVNKERQVTELHFDFFKQKRLYSNTLCFIYNFGNHFYIDCINMFFTVNVAFPSCVSDSGRERSASCQTRNSTQTAGPYREHHPVSSRGPAGDLTQTAEPLTLSQHWPSGADAVNGRPRVCRARAGSSSSALVPADLLPLNWQCWHCQNHTGSDSARMMAEHTRVSRTRSAVRLTVWG